MFLAKTIYLYLRWQFSFMKQSWTNSFNLSFIFECGNSCVEGRDVKILMLLQEEKGHGCMYPNIPVKRFRIHI
jgi:hypothetical protein